MEFVEKIQAFLENLDEKQFYRYVAIGLGIMCLATGIIVFRYYQHISYLEEQLEDVNRNRLQVKNILDKAQQVQQKQKEVNKILAEEEDFKIGGYFEDLLAKQGLKNKDVTYEVTESTDREGAYKEDILTAKFTDMTMKKLTELLQEIEKKQRIYAKELDIATSSKTKNTIEVTIAIGTLLPKPKEVT